MLTPTPWPVRFTCDVSTFSPTVTASAAQMSTNILYALTGYQFGLTQITMRPCRNYRPGTPFPDGWIPWPGTGFSRLVGATWSGGVYGYYVASLCGTCSGGCGCSDLVRLQIPTAVHDIVTVRVDGVPLVTGAYRLDETKRHLIRTDGYTWPYYNNLDVDDTHVGTWSVTANLGLDVPAGADLAMGELSCEILRAIDGQDCSLPPNVTSLVRQGVSINIGSAAETFRSGMTGLYLTDMFIRSVNPNGLRMRAKAYSVDEVLTRGTS